MRCKPSKIPFQCQQQGCYAFATCDTIISGFSVHACRKHHVCDSQLLISTHTATAKGKGEVRGEKP